MTKTHRYKLHFRRLELKYLLPTRTADIIIPTLQKYMHQDTNTGIKDHYIVNSLYYDSPNLTTYQQKLDGLLFRKKYRLRWYGTEQSYFFEIKRKVNDTVIKDRQHLLFTAPCTSPPTMEHNLQFLKASTFKHELINDSYHLHLKPQSVVSYKRYPLISNFTSNLRVTLDYDITTKKVNGQLHTSTSPSYLVYPDLSVLEIKGNARIPAWLGYIIKTHNLQRVSYSKYASAIDRLSSSAANTNTGRKPYAQYQRIN